ncbi:MAG: hypothetical protein WC292_03440 [Clostridia bacterium]
MSAVIAAAKLRNPAKIWYNLYAPKELCFERLGDTEIKPAKYIIIQEKK